MILGLLLAVDDPALQSKSGLKKSQFFVQSALLGWFGA